MFAQFDLPEQSYDFLKENKAVLEEIHGTIEAGFTPGTNERAINRSFVQHAVERILNKIEKPSIASRITSRLSTTKNKPKKALAEYHALNGLKEALAKAA